VNGRIKKFILTSALGVLFILVLDVGSWSGEVKRCIICGMDISKYPHTRYVVTTTEGEELLTCGVQCGLTLHLRLKERFKSAMALDLLSNRAFNAQLGFYVYKSTAITDMAPGFISFATRSNAEKFAKAFDGQVVSYEEALKIWKKQMQ
jgi:NosL